MGSTKSGVHLMDTKWYTHSWALEQDGINSFKKGFVSAPILILN